MNRARELLALREKATPGPWANLRGAIRTDFDQWNWIASVQISNVPNWPDNAEFIAAAHDMADTIAALLDEIKRLRAFHNLHCMDEELLWCKCGKRSSGNTLECRNCGGAVEGAVLLTPNAELSPRPEMPS